MSGKTDAQKKQILMDNREVAFKINQIDAEQRRMKVLNPTLATLISNYH